MTNLIELLVHSFFPSRCMTCNAVIYHDEMVCKTCVGQLPHTGSTVFERNGLDGVVSPFYYRDGVDDAVRRLKFDGVVDNARKLGAYMAQALTASGLIPNIDVVIPVPMHRRAHRRRGYNQAVLLARQVCRRTKLPLGRNLLVKRCQTAAQHNLTAQERATNLKNAFAVHGAVHGKSILLVDDVLTTGATAQTCADTLRKSGAVRVYCLVAAQTSATK